MTNLSDELRTIADTIETNGGWHIAAVKVRAAADELERLRAIITDIVQDGGDDPNSHAYLGEAMLQRIGASGEPEKQASANERCPDCGREKWQHTPVEDFPCGVRISTELSLIQRLKNLGQGGFDLDFDALDKVTPEARKQCAEAESLACEAAAELDRLQVRINGYADTNVELRQMLREARAGLDVIATKNGEPRWDLAKRIDTALGDAHEPSEQLRVCPKCDRNWISGKEACDCEPSEQRCEFVGMYDIQCGLKAGHEGKHKIFGPYGLGASRDASSDWQIGPNTREPGCKCVTSGSFVDGSKCPIHGFPTASRT